MGATLARREQGYLSDWYRGSGRKPLIIRGARQVGKSTLVRQFAERQKLRLVEINFERNPEYRQAFVTKDPTQILSTLELLLNVELSTQNWVLFLDEIQASPEAIAALRYFYEKQANIPVLAAGSLLEFTLENANFSMPVGRIEYMHMGPMTFSDYLCALGEEILAKSLEKISFSDIKNESFPPVIHQKLMTLFRQYCVVGGMPEAVARFVDSRSYKEVLKVQSSILATYRDDFNKYSQGAVRHRLQLVFDKAPVMVGNKFKYVHVSKDHRAAELRQALSQLCMARVLSRVHHSSANGVPLGAEKKDTLFKIIFMDVGLLCSALNINELNIEGEGPSLINKGAVAEQFIGQHLLYSGEYFQVPSMFYWVREAKSTSAEIDYLMSIDHRVLPIEIKAGATGTLRSLHQFCQEKKCRYAMRFNAERPSIAKDVSAPTTKGPAVFSLLSLPLYLAGESRRLAKAFLNQSF